MVEWSRIVVIGLQKGEKKKKIRKVELTIRAQACKEGGWSLEAPGQGVECVDRPQDAQAGPRRSGPLYHVAVETSTTNEFPRRHGDVEKSRERSRAPGLWGRMVLCAGRGGGARRARSASRRRGLCPLGVSSSLSAPGVPPGRSPSRRRRRSPRRKGVVG